MTVELKNHVICEETLLERKRLSALWKDDRIYDCTKAAAKLVLIYSTLDDQRLKKIIPPGRTIFCWDRENQSLLNVFRLSSKTVLIDSLEIVT